MRTRSALLVASCVLAASVVTGGALNESVGADKGIPPTHPQLTKFSKVSDIVMDKCMACHSRNYDLPFYAKIPGIKEIIEKDFNDGLRAMDLNLELVEAAKDKPIGEATLAKMEWVIVNETMPPALSAGEGVLSGPDEEPHILTLRELEAEHIRRVLGLGVSMERAAELLGINTVTLWRKRKELGA